MDRLLGSEDGLKRIEELMSAFGGMSDAPSPPTPPPSPPAGGMPDLGDMGQLLKLLPLIEQFGKEDESAALLHALRPHLTTDRQKRLDDAGQMLKLVRLLPLLKTLKGDDQT